MQGRPSRVVVSLTIISISMSLAALVGEAGAAFPGSKGLIAFSRNDEICVVNEDGMGMKNLTQTITHEVDPAFDSTGERLAFVRLNSDLAGDVVLMGSDGSTPRVIAAGSYSHPTFSPDTTKLVVARHGADAGLFLVATDGTSLTRLTQPNGDTDRAPAWSPDGSRIAFYRMTTNGTEIFTIGVDGSGETRLTDNSVADSDPNWAPDGSQIVFEHDFDLYKIAPDGSGMVRVSADPSTGPTRPLRSNPAFSPDGTRIAFQREGEIWTMKVDGTVEHRITPRSGGFSDLAPDWQPIPAARRAQQPRTSGSPTPPASTPPPPAEPTDARCTDGKGDGRTKSSVTITYNGRAFKGIVDSSDPRCVKGRKVLLKRRSRSGHDTDEGNDRSDDNGSWKIRNRRADGKYYARVLSSTLRSGGGKVVCRRADSKQDIEVIGVQPPD